MHGRAVFVRDGPSRPSLFTFGHMARSAGLGVLLLLVAHPAMCQLFARPWLEWHSVRSGRFEIEYPTQLEEWARFVASRMPAVDSAVTALVGYSPPMRVRIVVEDPFDISNGFAFTLLDKPVIVFWASPPDPRESIGQFRTWGEMLATHEFGHVAHLTRPSRNALTRLLWRIAPIDLGPIAIRSPRWAIEGYATFIEGRVTGSGRPHGFWRPAILRQWAIEGRLPTYDQLSDWSDFEGGSFAYLAGSAFLEWLTARGGDSSLVFVWRRLTARSNRSFDEAFTGVYGDSPRILYGRFVAQLTAESVSIDSALARSEVAGEMVQHLSRATGDPAISPDGKRVALVLRSPGRPAQVVVWSTTPESDSAEGKARERLLARDPQDVPARRVYPVPKRTLATLVARDGRSYEDPRWFPDGKRLLLWRPTRRPDGALRPELYEWTPDRGRIRRLTSVAGVRDADPSPDGRSAVALRCATGFCDVVVVDLANGALRLIRRGDVYTSFARPRWGPDSRTIAVAMQRENHWRIDLADTSSAPDAVPRFADPDDGANRFDPVWLGPNTLLVTSDRSGTPNLERIDLAPGAGGSAHQLTRVVGAAFAPEPNHRDGSLWFLSLHSQGYDVRRLPSPISLGELASSPLRDSRLAPATVEPSPGVHRFSPSPLSPAHLYQLGPRTTRWLPGGGIDAGGRAAALAIANEDPVGRLTVLAQGSVGNGDAWRGGALEFAWRRYRPLIGVSLFDASQDESFAFSSISSELRSGRLRVDYRYSFDAADVRIALGGAPGVLRTMTDGERESVSRNLGFTELAADARQSLDQSSASEAFSSNLSVGSTDGTNYQRFLAKVLFHGSTSGFLPIDLGATYGRVSSDAPTFERFVIGGPTAPFVDASLLTQQAPMPALPLGIASGDRVATFLVATSLAGLTPYYWGASARTGSGRFEQWQRVVGAELTIDQTPVPVLGVPGARLVSGIGESLDFPFRHRTRGYLLISLRP